MRAARCHHLLCVAVFGRRFRSLGVTDDDGHRPGDDGQHDPMPAGFDRPALVPADAGSATTVLAIASLSTAFAYALYFRVLSTAGATNASLVTMLIPPGAIIMGILVLDETVLPRAVGLALIIAGLLVTDGRIRPPRRG